MNAEVHRAWFEGSPMIIGDLTFQMSRKGMRIAIRCPPDINALCDRLAELMRDRLGPVLETIFMPFLEVLPDGWHNACEIPLLCHLQDDGRIAWGIGMPADEIQMMLFSEEFMNFAAEARGAFENWIEEEAIA